MKNQEQQREMTDEELKRKSIDELLAEILELSREIRVLAVSEKKWEELKPEIEKKTLEFRQLNFALRDRPKEPEDYLKWARALEADKETFSTVAYKKLRESEQVFEEAKTKYQKIVTGEKQLTEEEFRANIFLKIEEMLFHNFKNGIEAMIFSVQNSFYDNRFQAETTETHT